MKFRVEIVHIIILVSMVSHGVVGSNTELRSKEKDISLKVQLNSLNKPPIKSFMKNGYIIDCIDMYKQRAFDHPLLKNHKLQMRPSSLPKPTEAQPRNKTRFGMRNEVDLCPNGTVPFRRVQKDDLLRGKALLNQRRSRPVSPNIAFPASMHYAAVTTPVNNLFLQFLGGKTTLSVYNLTLDAQQISDAFLWIGSGVDDLYNSIEYGWTINPALYGDHEPRTYSLWTADGLHKTGCYNALCPGYVHVNRKRIMGGVTHPVSDPGKTVFAIAFSIFKDSKTGNWWLVEDFMSGKNEPMGYWPKELFPTMKSGARVVQLGGKVYSPPNLEKLPPMGSGAFVADDFMRTCYAANIKFVNSDYVFHVPDTVSIQVAADIPDIYKAHYLGDASVHHHPETGYTLLFGGPK